MQSGDRRRQRARLISMLGIRGTHLLEALVEFRFLPARAFGGAAPRNLLDTGHRDGDRTEYGLRVPCCDIERARENLVGSVTCSLAPIVDRRGVREQQPRQGRAGDQDQAQGPQSSVASGLHGFYSRRSYSVWAGTQSAANDDIAAWFSQIVVSGWGCHRETPFPFWLLPV